LKIAFEPNLDSQLADCIRT